MKKKANAWSTAKKALTMLGIGAGIGGGVAGVGFLIDQIRSQGRKISLPGYFDQMLMKNPDIKDLHKNKETKQDVEDYFKLLEDFAPKLVENPLSAGTFIRQLVKYSDLGPSTDTIETLSKITKNYSDAAGKGLGAGAVAQIFDRGTQVGFN